MFARVFRWGDDLGEELFHVENLYQVAINLGDRSQVVTTAGGGRRGENLLPVHMDDAVHRLDHESLNRFVEFGDDGVAVFEVLNRVAINRRAEIENGDGEAALVNHSNHRLMGAGDLGDFGGVEYLFDLEDVDPELLAASQSEEQ